jgi:hypothetical protein
MLSVLILADLKLSYIWESVEDKGIRQIARDAGQESAQAINKLDGLPYKETNRLNR